MVIFNKCTKVPPIYCIAMVFFVLIGVIQSCIPPQTETSEVKINISEDLTQQYILELSYRQHQDSLYFFLSHPNASYRYLAANALRSFISTEHLDTLLSKLQDPVPEVVGAAAQALGQLGSQGVESGLTDAFVRSDSVGDWVQTNKSILEALGKIGSINQHEYIAQVSTYLPTDTALVTGMARSLYYFSRRKIVSENGVLKAMSLLNANDYKALIRIYAAYYLKNTTLELLSDQSDTLLHFLRVENNSEVRLPLIEAIAKTKNDQVYQYLIEHFDKAKDYREKVAIINNLHHFDKYRNQIRAFILDKLVSGNYHISRSAADYFYAHGSANFARLYWLSAKNTKLLPEVSYRMYAASFRHMPLWHNVRMASMRYELYNQFNGTEDVYNRAKIIMAMGENLDNLAFISDSMFLRTSHPVEETALAEAFSTLIANPLISGFGKQRKQKFVDLIQKGYERLLKTDNVGSLAILAKSMRSSYFQDEKWIQLLSSNLQETQLPKDYESYIEIVKTLDYLQDSTREEEKIDLRRKAWNFNPESQYSKAIVKTTAGTIIMELYPHRAPISVSNFIELAQDGFYNNKTFHRVVSNFVVQTGCNIGDGYGTLDYTISSELANAYYDDPGMVGLASAGFHTESAQWFINMRATPHLNERYTIFARVISGLQVVHQLKIGDKISSIELIQ